MIKKEVSPGIIQITLDEDRWYRIENDFDEEVKYLPSVTWILESYPKGIGYHKWLASLGTWEEGQKIFHDAGERGGKVHCGVEILLKNQPLNIDNIMPNHYEPFTAKEWKYILSFVEWIKRYQPLILNVEQVVYDLPFEFAGTIDLVCEIDRGMFEKEPKKTGVTDRWIIDWKTSANIYESHKCQLAAYLDAYSFNRNEASRFGIVRLGSRHKCGYEFWQDEPNDYKHYFDLFLNVKKIWEHENPNPEPKTIDVPEILNLGDYYVEENDQAKNIERPEGQDQNGDESRKGR